MTQAELASAINISFQQLQKYEKGQNAVSPQRLAGICEALKLPSDYFDQKGTEPLTRARDGFARAQGLSNNADVIEFVDSAEGKRLIDSFMAIDDRRLRTRILDFIASFSGDRAG